MLSRLREWWRKRRKRAAIRAYVQRLGTTLEKTYGRDETYSAGRIRTALRSAKLSLDYEMHAVAMFATKDEFAFAFAPTLPAGSNLRELCNCLRREVAEIANHGSYRFMPKHWEDIGMDNGENSRAAARWGIGL